MRKFPNLYQRYLPKNNLPKQQKEPPFGQPFFIISPVWLWGYLSLGVDKLPPQ
ncbi:hypothetical protein [Parasedimentitalea huanghaiensis]|uniref:hypothetical protein n=1 Tax=Parasedimentitalea huanghaiensis TaxID=2682100 RepID=UPI001431381A|nr:hypothetical protein [Zongyanglinia huanghaiensis]